MSEHTQDPCTPVPPVDEQREIRSTDTPGEPPGTREASAPGTLPAEAQGEVHGGPLGCCLGTMVGLLLSLSLAVLSRVFIDPLGALFQANYGLLGLLIRILMATLACALAIFFGIIGWRLGKRFFREYEPPVLKERRRRVKTRTSV
ncbi:MAG TPA: hypothetical protein VGF67_30895 [Ktedonobacteraceae bacterium]